MAVDLHESGKNALMVNNINIITYNYVIINKTKCFTCLKRLEVWQELDQ